MGLWSTLQRKYFLPVKVVLREEKIRFGLTLAEYSESIDLFFSILVIF